MDQLGPVFWQSVAYEGSFVGHGPMYPFIWACHGSSNVRMGRHVAQDDAAQCLISMRCLFGEYLRQEKLRSANGDILPVMNVVVERFESEDFLTGKIVARIDIQRSDRLVNAWLTTTGKQKELMGAVELAPDEGAWEFFVRLLVHL